MPKWTNEQLEAIEKEGCNIIVSAGAGSGKTAVLSERVIRKLKQGVNINELLILTFTKAAAAEMKERIRKKIKDNKDLHKQLELIDSAYITTFDSYALSIVKKYYYLINVSPNINVVDSNLINLEKEKILDDIFEELYKSKDSEFEKLINDFTVKDDKNIRSYILKISNKLDMLVDKKEYLSSYIKLYFDRNFISNSIKDLENILIDKIDHVDRLIYLLSMYVEGDYIVKVKEILNPLIESKNYNEIKANITSKLPNMPKNSELEAKEYKKQIVEILKEIESICEYENKEELYENILITKNYVNIIIKIIEMLDDRINEFKFKNDSYEFNDIAHLSIKVLKENKEVREEIKNNLNEIMIDEYQDTNDIQEEFISYISNNNVYMVGDIKQSIYRFRNANPYIFKNKYDNYSKNIGGYKIDLNKNFRSREEVLNNINKMFDIIMDDSIGGAYYKESHRMIFGNKTYIEEGKTNQNNDFEIYNYEYDKESGFTKEEYEIFIIANDINNKIENKYKIFDKDTLEIRDCNYNDFVILMDRGTSFDLYKKIFEYCKIPLTILKDEKINDEIILLVIKNLLNILLKINKKEFDQDFKHMLVSILRSPFVNYLDDEIFDLFYDNKIFEDKIFLKLKEISKYVDSYSSKEIINILIKELNIYENIISIGNIKSNIVILDYIVQTSDNLSDLGYTIYDFVDYLNNIIENGYDIKFTSNMESSNSVKIMTIHKSKGLEYSICYYSGLYKDFNIGDLKDKFLFDNKYGIVTPYFNEGIGETFYKYLIKHNFIIEEISEKIRLFYVALTRAKEKMILVTDITKDILCEKNNDGILENNIRLKYRSFNDILLSIKNDIVDYITNITVDNLTKDYNKIKKLDFDIEENNNIIKVIELESNNELINENTFSKHNITLNTIEEINNMNLGTYMHYIFEVLNFKERNIDFIPQQYKNIVLNFLNQDILKNIENANIYKEYEFMYEDNNDIYHGIIDLMIVYDNHIDIIDYKLKNVTDENYIKQLNGYKNYIENKLNKNTNIYLYSILENKIFDLSSVK